jgi:chaperone BCS1
MSTDLVVPDTPATSSSTQLWPEALDTPGLIPRHMKRSGAALFPILEVLQRLLYRLRPAGTGDLEKALALIGLYQAIRPMGTHLQNLCLWAFTVEITISESDAMSRDILTWMGAEVISKGGRARSAMLVTGGAENMSNQFGHPMRFPVPGMPAQGADEEVLCQPPIGTRLFW